MNVGPFELLAPFAAGGMGQIWQARHGHLPVAVKFVSVAGDLARQMFAAEVRAHARLDHPHILQVLDLGTLESDLTPGLPAGTPWMALELASGGDLKTLEDDLHWRGVRVVLLTLLDALAHAHAHGVVHRDLKPANILISTQQDARPGLKLADFGIAHLGSLQGAQELGARELEPRVTGTPVSLAPEQCLGRLREYGPWTDLYALGCLATRLLTGRWPFRVNAATAAAAHLERSPPALKPRFAVPEGVQDWVARLLAKAPADRFRSCADAAAALLELGAGPGGRRPLPDALVATSAVVEAGYRGAWGRRVRSTPAGVAPMARDWRRPASPPPPAPLVDAGLQLFPLRSWETLGRDAELDHLWKELAAVRRDQRPRAVVLRGAPGIGVTHLGRAFVRRAVTIGAARGFEVRGSPDDGEGEALLRLLDAELVTTGLVGEARERVVRRNLRLWRTRDPVLVQLLVALLEGRVHQGTARRGAVRRLIRDRIEERAGILWIDDCEHAPDAVRLAGELLETRQPLPLLVVLGAGDAPLPQEIAGTTLTLGPLNPREARALVQRALPVEAGLRGRLLDDAQGVPAVLAHHLERWVRTEALVSSSEGYRLAPGRRFEPLVSAGGARTQRAESILGRLDARETRALLAAALLGDRVPHALWAPSSGTDATLRLRVGLLDRLLASDLARDEGAQWHWVDRAIRLAIVARAPAHLVQEARAAVVQALRKAGMERHGIQIARLLREGGEVTAALEAFLEVLLDPRPGVLLGVGAVAALCDEALELADELGIPAADPIRDALIARALVASFETAESFVRAGALVDAVDEASMPLAAATAHAVLAERTANADPERFEHHLRTVRRLLPQLPRDMLTADVEVQVVRALHIKQRNQEAFDLLMPLLDRARKNGWDRTFARGSGFESHIRKALGVPVSTQALLARAARFQEQGFLLEAASLLVDAADQARKREDLEASDALNHRVIELCDLVGLEDPAAVLNLCINALLRGDASAARRWLDEGIERGGSPLWRLAFAILELGWACALGDTQVVRERLQRYRTVRRSVKRALIAEEAELLELAACTIAPVDPGLARRIRGLG